MITVDEWCEWYGWKKPHPVGSIEEMPRGHKWVEQPRQKEGIIKFKCSDCGQTITPLIRNASFNKPYVISWESLEKVKTKATPCKEFIMQKALG